MKNKLLRSALLTLGFLITALVILLLGSSRSRESVVCSSPASYVAQADALEQIDDDAVPLAGQQSSAPLAVAATAADHMAASASVVANVSEQFTYCKYAQQAPAQQEPAQEEPAQEEPADSSTAATRLLDQANTLISEFNACATSDEKRALLNVSDSNFSNDSFRKKLLSDLGGSWEQLEDEVVAATEYQQGNTLYVQVFIAGKSDDYEAVIYSTKNADLSGNQWNTNLIYNDETATWMEYTQKHPYNDSRVGYYVTSLRNNEGGWDELKETMEESDVWQPVEEPADDAPAADDAGAEG